MGVVREFMRAALVGAFALSLATPAAADSVTLGASHDNMLIESATGALSNGAGDVLAAGRTGQFIGSIRRGLISFDVSSSVPAGSTISSVELTLTLWRSA